MKVKVRIIILLFSYIAIVNTSFAHAVITLEIISNPAQKKESSIHLLHNAKNKQLPVGMKKKH